MTFESTGGFAIFTILIILFYLYIFVRILIVGVFGGSLDLSYSSKGFIPQFKAFRVRRKEQIAEIQELEDKYKEK